MGHSLSIPGVNEKSIRNTRARAGEKSGGERREVEEWGEAGWGGAMAAGRKRVWGWACGWK